MKRYLCLLLALISINALAEWKAIAISSVNAKVYYEPSSIKQYGDNKRLWILVDLPSLQANNAKSQKEYREYDCNEERMKILQINYFSELKGEGITVDTDTDEWAWRYIMPNTIDLMILNRICKQS